MTSRVLISLAIAGLVVTGCAHQPKPGTVRDEAMLAGRTVASFPAADEDYFHDMDGGLPLTREQIEGRNMWLVWTGGDDRLWDVLSVDSLGSLDFLKTVSSHPTLPYSRDNRWNYLGLVNEPCFKKATGPDPNRYGLWLDVRDPSCPPDPFANADKYKGVQIGARGKTVGVGSYYGEPSGIVGLRLFPNPAFDAKARKNWDSERYYRDPKYYESRDLVKPYRVGMSCAFCHVGPNPVKPPADPENPRWENLSSNVGAQFFWWDRVFNWKGPTNPASFAFQALHTSLPGTLDTSLVSTDNINNPRTMNAVYLLGPRMALAKRWGKETLAGGGLDNKQFNDFVPPGDPFAQFFTPPSTTWTPRVLKDGADSVGALGALNRVYLNIGLFSEEWLLHFRPLIGGQAISPIKIADANRNSVYWQATEQQTPNMARFFFASTNPHYLKDAPGGTSYLTEDADSLRRGKTVFAERCARCHSSKGPPLPAGLDMEACNGKDYLGCWTRYWAWTKTEDFKAPMRQMVLADDFLKDNYLSTELRIPSTIMQTNICSPLATNAIAGNIWDNFSSQSYKDLPSVGSVKLRNPLTGAEYDYTLPGGGRGFTRPASLVSVWASAPYLQNNSVGPFDPSPSVQARMQVFQASIEQMLWPERRKVDDLFTKLNITGPGVGWIQRTTAESYIEVPEGYVPDQLRGLLGLGQHLLPFLFRNGEVEIGPIPQGTPVSLLTSIDLLASDLPTDQRLDHLNKLAALLEQMQRELKRKNDVFASQDVMRSLLALSKCPDYVINKGHYFGTNLAPADEPGLTDAEKRDLIGFLEDTMTSAVTYDADFIVVGSGAGGGTVAARLAEAGYRVLLLEAGGDPRTMIGSTPQTPGVNSLPDDYDVPAFHPLASENDAMKWDFFVRHYADSTKQALDPHYRTAADGKAVDGVLYPRAAALGGCTAHSAMILVYPHNADWNQIADLTGDASWRAENMRTYFERIEHCAYRTADALLSHLGQNPSKHGWSGWLQTETMIPAAAVLNNDLRATFLDTAKAVLQSPGFALTDEDRQARLDSELDPNDWRVVSDAAIGLRITPLTTRNHQRIGARERVLDVAKNHPDKLTIQLHALATRVLFDDSNRAIGVEYQSGDSFYGAHARPSAAPGAVKQVFAAREVILAGGAFNTPQLLMLSGIGPRADLEKLGIPVRVDLAGVGQNLQDRYEVAVVNRMNFPAWQSLAGATFTSTDSQYRDWADNRQGVYATNGALLSVIARSSAAAPQPDLFLYAVIGRFEGYFPGYSSLLATNPNYLTWVVLKAHTNNTAGQVSLRSTDPRVPPDINFHYFTEGSDTSGDDLKAVAAGVAIARTLTAGLKTSGLIAAEELPGDAVNDAALADFIQQHAWGHHASCTCRIGPRETGGVLSTDFEVYGVQGLRVVDASVFPRIPGFFIASCIYMIGEKAADVIIARAKQP